MLFVAAGKDMLEAPLAQRYAALAGPPSESWIIPEASHVGGLFVRPEEYAQKLLGFFDQYLR